MAKKKKSHYRWLLPLLGISCITISTCFFTLQKKSVKPPGKKRLVVAFLDSGLNDQAEALRGYTVRSIDFTGEGIDDNNGHGTSIVVDYFLGSSKEILSRMGIPPNAEPSAELEILSVKILNRFLETDEIKLLRGLQAAVESGAISVSIPAGGIRKKPIDAMDTCRKIIRIMRRNAEIAFFVSVGNEGLNLYTIDDVMIPQTCLLCPMPLQVIIDDALEDAIYLAERGMLDRAIEVLEYAESVRFRYSPAPISFQSALKLVTFLPECMKVMNQYLTPSSIQNPVLINNIQSRCGQLVNVRLVAQNIRNNLRVVPDAIDRAIKHGLMEYVPSQDKILDNFFVTGYKAPGTNYFQR